MMRAVAEKARARCNWRRLAGILFTVAKVVFADADHGVVVALLPVLGDVTVGEPFVAPGSRVLDVVPGGKAHVGQVLKSYSPLQQLRNSNGSSLSSFVTLTQRFSPLWHSCS